jgi:hypothetical protein
LSKLTLTPATKKDEKPPTEQLHTFCFFRKNPRDKFKKMSSAKATAVLIFLSLLLCARTSVLYSGVLNSTSNFCGGFNWQDRVPPNQQVFSSRSQSSPLTCRFPVSVPASATSLSVTMLIIA